MKNCRSYFFIPLSVSAVLASTVAQAAPVDISGVNWSSTGAAGLISGDSTIPVSPNGNALFGYVTTSGGVLGVSPLLLKTDGKGSEQAENGSRITSSVFSASKNDALHLNFNYLSTDGRGYDDYAWARLVKAGTNDTAAWLFTARSTNSARGNVVPGDVLKRQQDGSLPDEVNAILNNGNSIGFNVASTLWQPLGSSSGFCWNSANTCGPSGWIESDYTVATTGNYFLEFGVVNWGDEAYDSALAFDFSGLARARFGNLAVLDNNGTASVPEPGSAALVFAGMGILGFVARRRKLNAA